MTFLRRHGTNSSVLYRSKWSCLLTVTFSFLILRVILDFFVVVKFYPIPEWDDNSPCFSTRRLIVIQCYYYLLKYIKCIVIRLCARVCVCVCGHVSTHFITVLLLYYHLFYTYALLAILWAQVWCWIQRCVQPDGHPGILDCRRDGKRRAAGNCLRLGPKLFYLQARQKTRTAAQSRGQTERWLPQHA